MNVDGKFGYIFHNEKDGKSWITLSDSTKDLEGNWHNHSFNIAFKQGMEIPTDRSKINYKGFLRYYKDYITLQCTDWSYSDGATQQPQQVQEAPSKFNPFKNIEEDTEQSSELPF